MNMSKYGKYKARKKLRKYWVAFLGTGLFLVFGIALLLVGFYMTGWSLIDWLKSPYALTAGVILAGGVVLLIGVVITVKRHRLGE